jgi:hypothetical protein
MPAKNLRPLALVLAFCLGLVATRAAGWNSPGHMIIALVAYDNMSPAAKERAVALLRAHPRFADHFERAQKRAVEKGTDADKDQWLFAFASTWPDMVRSASGGGGARDDGARSAGVTREDVVNYSRVWWHFIDEPVYLSEAEEKVLAPTVTFNLKRDPPENPDDPDMNVVQAIKSSARIVGDAAAGNDLRSVRLCWLLHLVGDAHQPLHSSALLTAHRYPGGDHGGNFFNYEHGFNLHAFWDDVLCTEEPYETVHLLASSLVHNAELATAGQQAAAQLDPGAWIDEGHELAKQYVYTPEVRQKINAREGHPHLGDLNPSPKYEADAETVSERQAVIAGHRLAKLLEQLLKE